MHARFWQNSGNCRRTQVRGGTRHAAVSGDHTGEQADEQEEQDEQGEDWGEAGGTGLFFLSKRRRKVRDSPPLADFFTRM